MSNQVEKKLRAPMTQSEKAFFSQHPVDNDQQVALDLNDSLEAALEREGELKATITELKHKVRDLTGDLTKATTKAVKKARK